MKDGWDKSLIVAEIIGKVSIPLVVGGAALFFNSQTSQREQAARMAQIAVGILSEPLTYSPGETSPDPLRDWAVSVLQQPGRTVPLSEKAAQALRTEGLPSLSFDISNLLSNLETISSAQNARCIGLKTEEGKPPKQAEEECKAEREASQEHFLELLNRKN